MEELCKVTINYGTNKKDYNLKKGGTILNLKLENKILIGSEAYEIEGFYYDIDYENEYNLNLALNNDLILYAKLTYNDTSIINSTSKEEIVKKLDLYIKNLIDKTANFSRPYIPSWNQEGFKGRWNYIDGVFLNSLVALYNETGNTYYKDAMLNYINYYIDQDGNFINPETKEIGYREGELDSVCESKILFDVYEYTDDKRYLKAIENTYNSLEAVPKALGTINYSHKTSYPNQIWLDGMYMYVPFLARYAHLKQNKQIFDDIKIQYEYIRNHVFDEKLGLYYHGHDTSKSVFWCDKQTGNSKSVWLRSTGWFIVSLTDVLEYYPEGENKKYLNALLDEALVGILKYKDEKTNMFYQLPDKGPTAYLVKEEYFLGLGNKKYSKDAIIKNYLESSGSSMIAYSLMKSATLGYIDLKYKAEGIKIFEGIYNYSFKNNALNNICITAGLGPQSKPIRDGSPAYYLAEPVGSNDAKGVGPFLMAFIEYSK